MTSQSAISILLFLSLRVLPSISMSVKGSLFTRSNSGTSGSPFNQAYEKSKVSTMYGQIWPFKFIHGKMTIQVHATEQSSEKTSCSVQYIFLHFELDRSVMRTWIDIFSWMNLKGHICLYMVVSVLIFTFPKKQKQSIPVWSLKNTCCTWCQIS